jgi:hypothetical protein
LLLLGERASRACSLQLLEGLDVDIEAGGAQRLDRGGILRYSFLRCGEEVWTPQTCVYARGPAYPRASHPEPNENDETRKGPYLARQLSVFVITG